MEPDHTPPLNAAPSTRVAESWLSSFGKGIRLRIALTAAAIVLLALSAAIAFLTPLPRSWSEMRPAIFFTLVIISMIVSVTALLVRVRSSGKERAAAMDAVWRGLAEQSAKYTREGRRYHGRFSNRKFDAYVTTVREAHNTVSGGVYAGEHVEIILDTLLKVRLRAGRQDDRFSSMTDRFKGELSRLDQDAPEGLTVLAHDAEWGRWILRDEKAAAMLSDLLRPLGQQEIRGLSIWPGSAMLTLRRLQPQDLTAENVRGWLNLLAAWLERMERLPPTEHPAPENKWDHHLRGDRLGIKRTAYKIVFGFLLFITMTILGILWLLLRS